ncbi:hypothetical protein Tco_0537582 [Tanacetum coccineum]
MMCISQTQRTPANAIAKAYKDPEENKLIQKTRDMGSKWYCKSIGKLKLSKADLEGPAFKINLVNPEGIQVVPDVSKPLPLGGPPGQVTIQPQYFFNKDMEYLVSGNKERRNALSISKLKAAYYQDFGLEELVSSLWIESECEYDISAAYGISHLWFKCKEFYITRHSAPSDRRAIVLRKADYKEYKISEADFKNLHPNYFEDLYLLHLQGKLNHLSGADKVHHLLKFHGIKDAKTLWEAIKKDANLKLLRSLPSAGNNIALIMRNKADLDELSMDDLYNNLKVTNEAFNTAHDVPAARSKRQASSSTYADDVMFSFFVNQSNSPQAPRNQRNRNGDVPRRTVPVETPANALVVQDGMGGYDWSFQAKEGITKLCSNG